MGAWGRTCSRLKSRMRRLRAGVDIFLELKGVSRGWRGGGALRVTAAATCVPAAALSKKVERAWGVVWP